MSAAWTARVGSGGWSSTGCAVGELERRRSGFELAAVPELPGYILNDLQITDATGSDTLATMCLKIPVLDGMTSTTS